MEVLKENVAYLSNWEVLNALETIKKRKAKNKSGAKNQLATVAYETVRYLEGTPCKEQTASKTREFLKAVEEFKLTKCEKLSLLNLCPARPLEIQLLIEDGEDRLTEEQVESLLVIVRTHLGGPEPTEQQDEQMQES